MKRMTAMILLAAMLGTPAVSFAADEAKPAAAEAAGIRAVLAKHKGKRVSLRIGTGEEIAGDVVSVGTETVHLTELAGRDFFDAVVAIDEIVAVVYRAAK